jgi:hypothetical protein
MSWRDVSGTHRASPTSPDLSAPEGGEGFRRGAPAHVTASRTDHTVSASSDNCVETLPAS